MEMKYESTFAVRWGCIFCCAFAVTLVVVSGQKSEHRPLPFPALDRLPLKSSDSDGPRIPEGRCRDCGGEHSSTPLCGTDGRTYYSQCELDRARCQGHLVQVKHEGACPELGRCVAQKRQAEEQIRLGAMGVFVPQCTTDGAFLQVQCHSLTSYCWCVDPQGKVISGSSVHKKQPNCTQADRRNTFQRRASRRGQPKKGCTNADRSQFNSNLIEIFHSEYKRLPDPPEMDPSGPIPWTLLDTQDKRVIQWKFTELDVGEDGALQRREVRDLRKMVRRIVEPRECARTFVRYCDLDQDKRISRSEWSVCLGVDIHMVSFRLFMSLNSDEQHGQNSAPSETSEDSSDTFDSPMRDTDATRHVPVAATAVEFAPDDDDDDDGERLRPPGGGWGRPQNRLRSERLSTEEPVISRGDDDTQDCLHSRRQAEEQARLSPRGRVYVPECRPDGLYAEAQCHTGYCWCVNPRTGRPIRGIPTLGTKPDCAAARQHARAFKGCSYKKKQSFITELVEYFAKEMASNNSALQDSTQREQVVQWKFSSLDASHSKVLERKEWKLFRRGWKDFLSQGEGKTNGPPRNKLRKCWRNFLRYCDQDSDNRVTLEEWNKCTDAETSTRLPNSPKRRGPNPFSTILKST
ncbi:SPARC-related modular calcium-binding protein 2-like isoform X2 [Ornithodoros turicata]|uniref:SPARC-related modular calcium-binding protein 2-like isoform X2 n=1 Tax=Ornithodoros turicata TaxID=34597 RepID=UPI0031392DC0